jgi:hypothetical protein
VILIRHYDQRIEQIAEITQLAYEIVGLICNRDQFEFHKTVFEKQIKLFEASVQVFELVEHVQIRMKTSIFLFDSFENFHDELVQVTF